MSCKDLGPSANACCYSCYCCCCFFLLLTPPLGRMIARYQLLCSRVARHDEENREQEQEQQQQQQQQSRLLMINGKMETTKRRRRLVVAVGRGRRKCRDGRALPGERLLPAKWDADGCSTRVGRARASNPVTLLMDPAGQKWRQVLKLCSHTRRFETSSS